MRIYQASMGLRILKWHHKRFPNQKLNVLRSFGVQSKEDHHFRETHRDKCASLILDSGTFTKFNRKTASPKPITLPAYISYLNRFGSRYDWYFNFDECFINEFEDQCFAINIDNQRRLEEKGFRPVPVIHDIYGDEVDLYMDEGYEMVAVGSPQLDHWTTLYKLMNRFKGKEIKVHLFATSKWEYLAEFPIFSSDTTSWAKTGGFGSIFYWNPHKKRRDKREKIYLEDYLDTGRKKAGCFTTHPHKREIEEYLDQELGLTYEDLMDTGGGYYRMLVNAHFFVEYERWINAEQRKQGFFTAE
jgi:hypothetical protein